MGEDAADEAIPARVVHALVGFQNLTDFLGCTVFERHDLKMKLTKGLTQSIWKVKQEKSCYTTVSRKPQPRARKNTDQIKNPNQNWKTRPLILLAEFQSLLKAENTSSPEANEKGKNATVGLLSFLN